MAFHQKISPSGDEHSKCTNWRFTLRGRKLEGLATSAVTTSSLSSLEGFFTTKFTAFTSSAVYSRSLPPSIMRNLRFITLKAPPSLQ